MSVEWTAFLNDGRSINDKDLFIPKEDLPFKKLVKYVTKEDLTINAVTLNVNGIRYNSPSLSERGNFVSAIKPEKFWIFFRDRYLMMQNRSSSFVGLSWKLGDYRTILWVSTTTVPPISWIEIAGTNNNSETSIEKYYTKYS